jgi:hypothetical protein
VLFRSGWLIDRWLGTAPWFLAVGAILGNAAGIYLVWLRGRRLDSIEAIGTAPVRVRGGTIGIGEDPPRGPQGRG